MDLNDIKFEENIFFHGASNDRGRDPDHMRIRPPSPEHPFFITQSMQLAFEYSGMSTGDDGRLDINESDNKQNRIYVLRLVKNLDQLKNVIFHFDDPADVAKLEEHFGGKFVSAVNELFDDYRYMTVMKLGDVCASLICNYFTYWTSWINSEDDAERQKIIDHIYKDVKRFGNEDTLYADIVLGIVPGMSKSKHWRGEDINRRDIKAFIFEKIFKEGYKIVAEKNTMAAPHNGMDFEFAVMDMSLIKDICPYPISQKIITKVIADYYDLNGESTYKDKDGNIYGFSSELDYDSKIIDTEKFLSILKKYI